ncbi:MAG: hypothetical protein KIT27_02565 [Legionellales bacterium]|nr:hypothetical protein [Legionellales bacterium]
MSIETEIKTQSKINLFGFFNRKESRRPVHEEKKTSLVDLNPFLEFINNELFSINVLPIHAAKQFQSLLPQLYIQQPHRADAINQSLNDFRREIMQTSKMDLSVISDIDFSKVENLPILVNIINRIRGTELRSRVMNHFTQLLSPATPSISI